jgi:hypothetical protein
MPRRNPYFQPPGSQVNPLSLLNGGKNGVACIKTAQNPDDPTSPIFQHLSIIWEPAVIAFLHRATNESKYEMWTGTTEPELFNALKAGDIIDVHFHDDTECLTSAWQHMQVLPNMRAGGKFICRANHDPPERPKTVLRRRDWVRVPSTLPSDLDEQYA